MNVFRSGYVSTLIRSVSWRHKGLDVGDVFRPARNTYHAQLIT